MHVQEGATEGLLAIRSPWPSTIRDVLGDYDRSRKVESLLLVSTRWSKLCNDFFSEKKCAFNLSKVPDIFDMARYDLMHNNDLDEEFVEVVDDHFVSSVWP